MTRGDLDLGSIPPRFEGARDRAAYLLAEYKIAVMFAAGALTILLASGRVGVPEIPPALELILRGVAIGIIPAMFLAKIIIIDRFFPDPREKVIEWNPYAEDSEGLEIRHWRVETDLWRDRVHEEGMPILEPDRGDTDAIVTRFEFDEALDRIRVRGVDPDIADPTDLKARNGMLDAIFGELTDAKRELDHMRATGSLRQYQIEESTINALIAAIEERVAFSPGATEEIVSDELFEGFDEESKRTDARTPEDLDRPTLSELEQTAEQAAATDGGAPDGDR